MGCFCSSFRRAEPNRSPQHFYHERVLQDYRPLTSTRRASSTVSVVPLADSNPEGGPSKTAHLQPANSQLVGEANGILSRGLEKSGSEIKSDGWLDSPKLIEGEPIASATNEEDVCPTCLEEYDFENPRIITKCRHDFHLSCILQWQERSNTCPICDQIMLFEQATSDQ